MGYKNWWLGRSGLVAPEFLFGVFGLWPWGLGDIHTKGGATYEDISTHVGNGPGQSLGSNVISRVLTTRLVQ